MRRLANEAALALGRTRSAAALGEAFERERLVAAIGLKVRSELDLEAVLKVAVEETAKAVGVSRCFVRLGVEEEPMRVVGEWDAPGVQPVAESAARLPVLNLALRERRTFALDDMMNARELDDPSLGGRAMLVDLDTAAVLATPILVFDRMIGVFAMHRQEPTRWTREEIALAEAVAGELGLAIHTASLLGENERRLQQQGALIDAAEVLTSDLDFDSVGRRLVQEVVDADRRRRSRLLDLRARPQAPPLPGGDRCPRVERGPADSARGLDRTGGRDGPHGADPRLRPLRAAAAEPVVHRLRGRHLRSRHVARRGARSPGRLLA